MHARRSKARLSSAKYMTCSQIGFLDALNMPWVWHDGLRASTGTSVQACFCQGSMYVYMYWSSTVRLRRAKPQDAHACVSYRCCGSLTLGSTINVSEVMNLRKLAQARPTMPCIPLVLPRVFIRPWIQVRRFGCKLNALDNFFIHNLGANLNILGFRPPLKYFSGEGP